MEEIIFYGFTFTTLKLIVYRIKLGIILPCKYRIMQYLKLLESLQTMNQNKNNLKTMQFAEHISNIRENFEKTSSLVKILI